MNICTQHNVTPHSALRASVLMDSEQLHTDILAHLSSDPVAQKHIGITSDLRWMQSDDGFLRHDN